MGSKGKDSMFRYADGVDKLLMFFGTLGSIGDGLQYSLTMFVLSNVINEYGSSKSSVSIQIVNKYALRLLYVAIGVGLSAFVEGICWTRTAERQTSRMRMEYLKSVLRQEVSFFDTQAADTSTTYQVVSTISSDANSILVAMGEKIPDSLAYMSSFIFCLIFGLILSWRLSLAALPFTFMFLAPGLGFGKLMMDLAMKMIESYGVAGGIAEQAISSIRTIYSYVGERQTLNRFSAALQKTMEFGIKQGFAKGLLMGSMGIIYPCNGRNILSALPNLTSITEATSTATRIFEMIDRNPNIDSEDKKGKALSYVRGEIEFKDIDFSYPSRPDTPILQGLNLKFPAGKTVGLVGGSGSGKSTVISLLQRFYDPIEGEILLDGYKIKKLQLKWLRSQMGLVNQEPVLFAMSIKENILFGKDGASMDDVQTAAKAANAHDFIVKLPDGYETQVGQFGFQLSGGQKQRIAIARALLRDPKILLLDEATSALDTQSERIVQEAIDQASQGRTTIVIAHRLSTIRMANMIVVLQSGRVAESGTHDELIQMNGGQGGEYFKMVQLQQMTQNDVSNDSDIQIYGRNYNRMTTAPSPISARSIDGKNRHRMVTSPSPMSVISSIQSTPALNPFSPAFSMGTPYSITIDHWDESFEEDLWNSTYPPPSQWRLLKMNVPEWGRALLGCIGALGAGAVQPINAYCVGAVISAYFLTDKHDMKSKTRTYSFIFLGLSAFNFISSLLQHYNFAVMGEKLTKRVREKLLEKLLTFEIGWFDQDENSSAAICARLNTEANMSMSEKARKAQKEGSQLASEAVINHRTITAFSSQKRILGLFKATLEGPKKESIRQSWFSGLGLFSSQFLSTASTALAYWYGGRLLSEGLITSERLFQAFLVLLFTAYIIAEAGSMTSDINKGSTAIGAVFAILDRKSEIDPETSWGVDSKKARVKGHIELKNVFFSYPTRPDQLIFKGLYLKIEAGRTVALVGQSGSGKSTIIGLIERFYDPTKGSVHIDEQDIKNYNLRFLRSHIALVSQEPTLFAGTIHENIAYGKENARESEIRKAAVLANAHEFVSGMKDGYETYCGERGVQLSGGQKQRIALARAILKNPSILLLDEATSALDSVSENLVQEALEKMMVGRTCVVVAHRLSTIQKANSIAVIKDGKVVEKGSHSDLLSIGRGGAYYSLINQQASNTRSGKLE
ncbi:hypothetical protein L1049_000158 [Liquidambar formosana]|uniref:Multidrug resistance protein n=1 Tax=Liquidambar formosana TaxID=63359 RepID=A0AAP0R565_LIQFO